MGTHLSLSDVANKSVRSESLMCKASKSWQAAKVPWMSWAVPGALPVGSPMENDMETGVIQ